MNKRGLLLVVLALAIAGALVGVWALNAPYSSSRATASTPRPAASQAPVATTAQTPASPAASPWPPPPVDKAVYDARMLALANLKPEPDEPRAAHTHGRAGVRGAKASAKAPKRTGADVPGDAGAAVAGEEGSRARPDTAEASPRRKARKPALWPVHAAYPDAGAILPFHRVVAYYGNFYSKKMGILGEFPPAEVLARLQRVTQQWTEADPSTPAIPALDYIVVSAQAAPGKDGLYRLRMPDSQIEKAVQMADQVHGLLFLDVQPGWSTVQQELPRLAKYMKLPNVELALDPEFALPDGSGKKPGAWRGTMSAAQINWAARWLAGVVEENHLKPKILVVHRFTQAMVTGYRSIRPLPQVEIVMDMDGFGSPHLKRATYRSYIAAQPVQFTGFKLFYKNDVKWGGRLLTPAQILALSPRPIYIVYQ